MGTTKVPQFVHLVQYLSKEEKTQFTEFLKEKKIKFAWSYADMCRLDPEFIKHHLSIAPRIKPVKPKLRKMHPHVALLVKVELEKLLKVGFIRVIAYARWISNVVLVSKAKKSIRICMDFRDLNKYCPKDDFPLPNIDMIIDLTTRYEIYSLMDGFLGYKKINISPKDQ